MFRQTDYAFRWTRSGICQVPLLNSFLRNPVPPSDILVPQPDKVRLVRLNFNACFQQLTMVSGLHRS
jgi:hypothetical protein